MHHLPQFMCGLFPKAKDDSVKTPVSVGEAGSKALLLTSESIMCFLYSSSLRGRLTLNSKHQKGLSLVSGGWGLCCLSLLLGLMNYPEEQCDLFKEPR